MLYYVISLFVVYNLVYMYLEEIEYNVVLWVYLDDVGIYVVYG